MKRCAALLIVLLFVSVCAGAAEAPATRGDFVAALWTADSGVPVLVPTAFSDVGPNETYTEGVSWAYERSLALGVGDGLFLPERPITREEAATILRRYCAWMGWDTFLPDGVAECNDYEGISPWADDSLYWATDVGLIEWSQGGRLDPLGPLTATQVEQLMYRVTHWA